jgi:hypothetical protein
VKGAGVRVARGRMGGGTRKRDAQCEGHKAGNKKVWDWKS